MLNIYHSNHPNRLKTIMEFVIEDKQLDHPFDPEIIIVQNTAVAQWLSLSFSKKFGIAANIEFPSLANFIWNIFIRLLPGIPEQSGLNKQAMCWKLMRLLPEMLKYDEFSMLNYYLNNDSNKRKLFQVATRITDLYHKYMIYRPYWLTCWEEDKQIAGLPEAQTWQASLWKTLIQHTRQLDQQHWHYANLYEHFINILKNTSQPQQKLPTRVFIYGIYNLPPLYLKIINSLSEYIDIHILFMNPCRYYCNDIHLSTWAIQPTTYQDIPLFSEIEKPIFKTKLNDMQNIVYKKKIQNTSNPLLTAWGKTGRDYIHMLSGITSLKRKNVNTFVDIEPNCLLHNLQHDILEQKNNTIINLTTDELSRSDTKPYKLDPEDRSVTIHVCHSIQREVEVLHDNLLAILEKNTNLTTRDIIVMVTDIDSYTPFIQAVFGSATNDRYLPYTISYQHKRQSNSILEAFLYLLSLPNSRFTSENVLNLLDVPALGARFNINKEGIQYLRQWINESGVRWGIDNDNVQEFKLPITGQHTWQFGLMRMLLGYAMDSSHGEWNKILPYDESNGLIAELVGNLASFIAQLDLWRHRLRQERILEAWKPICKDIINDFFLQNSETDSEITLIQQQWYTIINEGINAHYEKPIPLSLLKDKIVLRLDQKSITYPLLSEGVKICTLMSISSIPFKVICLLGMNNGVYPRIYESLSFDLMQQKQKLGDYNCRDNDRYLFLEILISAKEKFYISYIGRSVYNNNEHFPSILVQELLDYICQSHYLFDNDILNYDHNIQRVKEHITFFHSRMPFDPINYIKNEQQSYALEWLPAARKTGIAYSNFTDEQLDYLPLNTLSLKQLLRFWMHPVRAFFQMRLKVNFYSETSIIPDTEPFTLDGLNCYKLNQQILHSLIQKDTQKLFRCYQIAGKLPYGVFGEIIWDAHCREMQIIADKVIKHRKETVYNQEINLECNGIRLTGWLQHVQSNGLLRWRPSIHNITNCIQLWLEHLIYCASGGTGESRIFFRKNKEWCYPPLPREQALYYLSQLIEGYQEGMRKPLLLLPESGGAWIKTCYDITNDNILTDSITLQKARMQFLQVYTGNLIIDGEGNDIWYQRLWKTLEPKYFDAIIQEAKRYIIPIYKYNQSYKDQETYLDADI